MTDEPAPASGETSAPPVIGSFGDPAAPPPEPRLIKVDALRPSGERGGCLRPLGLCELGGSCDLCWYGSGAGSGAGGSGHGGRCR